MGTFLIIETLILPKCTSLTSSCVVPKTYINEIESCFYRFIWKEKPDKIKRLTLIGIMKTRGRVNMVDITVILNRLKCHGSKDCLVQKHQIGKIYEESI